MSEIWYFPKLSSDEFLGKNLQESQPRKWSWKIAKFTLIWIQNIVTDKMVSEIVEKWISREKLWESWPRKWSWKIVNLVMESHGKVMEFHFQGFVGTLIVKKKDHTFLVVQISLWCYRYPYSDFKPVLLPFQDRDYVTKILQSKQK